MADNENWDDANEAPYIPNIDNRPVIRKTPANLSKAQKKKFYEQERERWAKFKNNSVMSSQKNSADKKLRAEKRENGKTS